MSDQSSSNLVIRAGRVVCPAGGLDGPGAVAIRGDRLVAAGTDVPEGDCTVLEFPNGVLLPGLVDLHAHPACQGSKYGIDPDVELLPRGTTTVLSQGDAGADNWPRYRETTIEASQTRVRMAINLSAHGESIDGGCFERLEDCDVDRCVRAIERDPDLIWGIAVNVSRIACGSTDPGEVMRRGLLAAERTGKPLLVGLRQDDDWPIAEQLAHLRSGDVVTYCFRPDPYGIVENGRVRAAAREARERGVLFDVGHGMTSFSFASAEAAIGEDFLPDTISTDFYARHVGSQPSHDLPRTMSKLLAAGMTEADVFTAATSQPTEILGLSDQIGTLAAGTCADIAVLAFAEDTAPLVDVLGIARPGPCWEAVLTVCGGRVVPQR